jgi:hypothetical protein
MVVKVAFDEEVDGSGYERRKILVPIPRSLSCGWMVGTYTT